MDRLKSASPEDKDGEIRAIVAKSLMDHLASVRDNIKRHPEFEGRIAINGPRPGAPINSGASLVVMPVQRVDNGPISVGYGLSLGSTIGVPRIFGETGIRDGNHGIDPGTANGTITHEFGHALDTDASLVRAGINPRTDDLIGDIAKDYPQLQDSIFGIIYALQTPQITDPATKISDIPRGSINAEPVGIVAQAAASLKAQENTQTSMANSLLALIAPTVKLRQVRIPGENIIDTEPSIYDVTHFADQYHGWWGSNGNLSGRDTLDKSLVTQLWPNGLPDSPMLSDPKNRDRQKLITRFISLRSKY